MTIGTTKAARHAIIRRLIGRGGMDSQDTLASALAHQGVDITQPTLSRDLREIGVLKGPSGYVLASAATPAPQPSAIPTSQSPSQHATPSNTQAHPDARTSAANARALEAVRRALRTFAIGADHGGTIAVLRTNPAAAPALAAELDRARSISDTLHRRSQPSASHPLAWLGTIAGDDTIFIACRTPAQAAALAGTVRSAIGAPQPDDHHESDAGTTAHSRRGRAHARARP